MARHHMRTLEEYQDMAAQCSHLASAVNDPDGKAILLEAAQTWIKLAEYEISGTSLANKTLLLTK